jgi:glycosyltransferase involved in cell wall biosynthesis
MERIEFPRKAMPDPSLSVTVVITTRNRSSDLARALQSTLAQDVAMEVLVIDDGSTDGTAEMVRDEFPSVRVERSAESHGLIVQRNRAARLANGDVIISIDDDAVFTSPRTVGQTLREFSDARIGAVAIPFRNADREEILQRAPDAEQIWLTDRFIGTAHALRRDVFLKCGGYRDFFVHQGEEGDFCLRMLNAGFVVRLGSADPIHHLESPRRSFDRMDFYGRRNDILFASLNVPWAWLVPHLAATTLNGLVTAKRVGRFRQMLRGLYHGYGDAVKLRKQRKAVSSRVYRLSRHLKKQGAVPLLQIAPLLPA